MKLFSCIKITTLIFLISIAQALSQGVLKGVETEEEYIPQSFSLEQNYPNPFNPSTIITFN